MTHPLGWNPMDHECGAAAFPSVRCYLIECNPRTEWFADIFPGKISISDMDKIVEISGRALVFEWKRPGGKLTLGQEIMWARLTRGKMITTFAVNGTPKDMVVYALRVCWNGKWGKWEECGLLDLRERIVRWKEWALKNPVFTVSVNK